MKTRIAALAVVTLVVAVSAFAHHSDVAYELTAIELKNVRIISYAWKNPHGIVVCDVKDGDKAGRWTLETGSPSAMLASGWTQKSLAAEDMVTLIDVNPAKNGTKFGRLLRVTKADGTVLNYREPRRP